MKKSHPASLRVYAPIVLSVLLAAGCQDEGLPHFGTLRYESESFEVWASEGLEACGGTFEYTEQWLAAFRGRVGEYGNPARHRFYWLTPEDYDNDMCPPTIACAYPYSNVIYSTVIPYEHEIVHTEIDAQPPSVLREGIAEVFGSIESPYVTQVADLDPLLDAEQISGDGYRTAGRFSRFLIERHGLDAYFELYLALDGTEGRDAFANGVAQVLGADLPTLVADFEQSSPCSTDRWRFFDHECSTLPLTPWESPTRWADEIDLRCAAPDVIGPRRDLVWTRRALEVEQAGSYELTIASAEPTAQVAIFPCGGGCFDGEPIPATPSASVATGGRATVFLAAGRHWMQVEHAASSEAAVTVALER